MKEGRTCARPAFLSLEAGRSPIASESMKLDKLGHRPIVNSGRQYVFDKSLLSRVVMREKGNELSEDLWSIVEHCTIRL